MLRDTDASDDEEDETMEVVELDETRLDSDERLLAAVLRVV